MGKEEATYRIPCALEISDVNLSRGRLGLGLSSLLRHSTVQ